MGYETWRPFRRRAAEAFAEWKLRPGLLVNVVGEIPSKSGFFRECARLLKPGSTLVEPEQVNVPDFRLPSTVRTLPMDAGLREKEQERAGFGDLHRLLPQIEGRYESLSRVNTSSFPGALIHRDACPRALRGRPSLAVGERPEEGTRNGSNPAATMYSTICSASPAFTTSPSLL
jgi:hypothetical protein